MHLADTKQAGDDIESTADGDILFPDWIRERAAMGEDTQNHHEHGSTLTVSSSRHGHRKQQHSRTLSDIFTKLTAVVTDPFDHEGDYDGASVDPLQSAPILDPGLQSPVVQENAPRDTGKRHRRVFSSDRVHPTMAHRRLDSIGHSFFIHRNYDGGARSTPMPDPMYRGQSPPPQPQGESAGSSHRRIDSAGLDLLTVAAHAFNEEDHPRVSKHSFAAQEMRLHNARSGSVDPDRIREDPMNRVYNDDPLTSHPRAQWPHHPQPIFRDRADRPLEPTAYPYQRSNTSAYPMQQSKLDAESHPDDYYHETSHHHHHHHPYSHWEGESVMAPPAPMRKHTSVPTSTKNRSSNSTRSNRHVRSDSWKTHNTQPSFSYSLPTSNPSGPHPHHHVSWAQKEPVSKLPVAQGHSSMYRQDSSWYDSHPQSTYHHEKDVEYNSNISWKNAPSRLPHDTRHHGHGSNYPWNSHEDESGENMVVPGRHKRLTTADIILNDLHNDSELALEPTSRNPMTANRRSNRNDVMPSDTTSLSLDLSSSDDGLTSTKRVINGGTSRRVRRKCEVEGCTNRTVQGGRCIGHGAKRRICGYPGCTKHVKKAGMCSTHGPARKRCSIEGCGKVAVQGGRCVSHGAKKKTCSVFDCPKQATLFGMCKRHHDAVKDQDPSAVSEGTQENTVASSAWEQSQVCLPVSSSVEKHGKSHQRGLSIFHEMSTVDTILASSYASVEFSEGLKEEVVDLNLSAATSDNTLNINAVSV